MNNERYLKLKFTELDKEKFSQAPVKGGWVAMLQHYFIGAWVADPKDDRTSTTVTNGKTANTSSASKDR